MAPSWYARTWVVAVGSVGLLLAVAPRYGWHRDELYFLEAGQHLAWGYVDQPPFTPFVARIADAIAPGNLVVLRLLPALATAVTIVLSALIARELGASRRGQTITAAAVAGGGFVLGAGHLLATATFDLTAWMALLWVTARLLRTADPRLWLAFGGIAGAALLNKSLVPLLAATLALALVIERRWDLVRSPWLAAGAALAAVIASPQLVWQASNGWPQFDMAKVLAERLATENRVTLLPGQLVLAGAVVVFLLPRGARWLARTPEFRPFLWAWPIAIVACLVTAGRPYYVLPLTIVVMIAGVVATDQRDGLGRLRWWVLANAIVTIPVSLPLLPASTLPDTHMADLNEAVAETVGWPEMVEQVAKVVRDLPADEQRDVILLAGSYGDAGALDRFGPGLGLPPAHSPHNNYWFWRQPARDDATLVAVSWSVENLRPYFRECEQVATVDNGLDVESELQGASIVVCRGLRGTWDDVWPQMKFLS